MSVEDDHYCFACGKDNPHGLQISWNYEGLTTTAQFIPEKKYQGWKGMVHGGIIATLLDEAMARLACKAYGPSVTAEITVRYISPARVGEVLQIRGEVVKESPKLFETKAMICNEEGKVLARATGKVMRIS